MPVSDKWTFFTNHAHVLFCISKDPDIRMREVATKVGITERAAQRIVAELEEAGYLEHERQGRRNHYDVLDDAPLRHPVESEIEIRKLLEILEQDMAHR
jgi:predicted ArsR family transcriptional regulator